MHPCSAMFAALTALLFAAGEPAQAQPAFASADPMVQASLVSDRSAVAPGETFSLALHQEITPGWHTYWRNPGDSGEPTRLELSLPEGWTATALEWPAPTAYPLGPLTNYGYSDRVTLPLTVTAPADASGPVTIEAAASWLVCEDICIPEDAALSLTLDVGESRAAPDGAALIADARRQVPPVADDLDAGLLVENRRAVLTASGALFAGGAERIRNIAFFPYEAGVIDHAAAQDVRLADGAMRLETGAGFDVRDGVTTPQGGVITFERFENGAWRLRSAAFEAQPGVLANDLAAIPAPSVSSGVGADGSPAPAPVSISFLQAAVLALAGGLLLNLMPCVFPILSMKALTLVRTRDASRGEARIQGLLYGAGTVATFLALGGALLALRVLGLPDLWGFQLQSPLVVMLLAGLMFLIGLNFLGAFEIGTSLQGVGGSVKGGTRSGAFLTGVLAVFVAAPCLAPFMAGALAFAFTQPPLASLTVFGFLGLGLAAPFVLVAFQPGLLSILPRPGAWMERFKQFLAFPMFATAVWLIWVLSVQTGAQGVLFALLTLLALGFAVWAFRMGGLGGRATAAAGAVASLAAVLMVSRLEPVEAPGAAGAWEDWSVARVEQLQAEGRPVFVDFTAAWCVTCQVNKLGALSAAEVRAAFAEHDVALLRADFTNREPEIAAELNRRGSAGVPLYLVFPAGGGEPAVLPPLLTEAIVIRSVEDAV